MYMTTLISKTILPFCHERQRISKSSSHLLIIGQANILIPIIIIIIRVTIIVLVLRCLLRRRGRLYEATKVSLPSSNTVDMGVHLTQLIIECVKVSIHALQLRHDHLEGHTTCWWRRCRCGKSGRSRRSHCLCQWLFRSKLGLVSSDSSSIYGTHDRKMRTLGIRDIKMAKNPHNSQRKNELITGRRIPIDIYKE